MTLKSFLGKKFASPSLAQRRVSYVVLGVFFVLAFIGTLQSLSRNPALSAHRERCKAIKEDSFCNAVKAYYRVIPNKHIRVKITGNLMVVNYPGVSDSYIIRYDIRTGEMVEMCGFWVGYATQKFCVQGEELEQYLSRK